MDNPKNLPNTYRDIMLDRLEGQMLQGRINRRRFIQYSVALGASLTASKAMADLLDDARANQDARLANLSDEFEVIVCGGGTTGCTLAGRLAEAGVHTLLIEAGDWDTADTVLDPSIWFMNLGTERDWGDVALAGAGVNDRAIPSHMARVLGGGSSINATIWVRGHRNDYDGWAEAAGDKDWGYDNALEIFRRIENWQGVPSPYRGQGGKIWVQPSHDPLPIAPAMLDAVRSLDMNVYDDLNGERETSIGGFALMNQIIKEGRRANMAQAYLYPVLGNDNLTVMTNAHVQRLHIEDGRVTGVEVKRGGEVISVQAGREVVLSQGAIRTPQTLMLSGIGDSDKLGAHEIKAAVHAPEVGQNFHDHILHGGCIWESPEQLTHRNSGSNASGFWKSDAALDTPDLNIVQIELPYTSDVIAKEYGPPANSWALCAGLVAPKSRGSVALATANPEDKPIVDANFLGHPDDVTALMAGIDLCRQIGNTAAMAPYATREVIPGKDLDSEAKADFVKNGATTFFHQVGTCRMGKDDGAVVNAKLQLQGVDGLRIADGSIMPQIPSCATMASCVFIGERAADIMLER